MAVILCLVAFFLSAATVSSHSDELSSIVVNMHSGIDYAQCRSIQEAIDKETQGILSADPSCHDQLAQLYVARGESYLLDAQYDKAVRDFQIANFHIGYCLDMDLALVIAFRVAFGEVVSYDNLGMQEQTQDSLDQLKIICAHLVCSDYAEAHTGQLMVMPAANKIHFRDLVVRSAGMSTANGHHKASEYILKTAVNPNEPQPIWWCEQTVKNTSAVLKGIALNIPSTTIRFSAMELIKELENKAIACCRRGGLWSACMKPLADKFAQWNRKWSMFGIPPDPSWDSDL